MFLPGDLKCGQGVFEKCSHGAKKRDVDNPISDPNVGILGYDRIMVISQNHCFYALFWGVVGVLFMSGKPFFVCPRHFHAIRGDGYKNV